MLLVVGVVVWMFVESATHAREWTELQRLRAMAGLPSERPRQWLVLRQWPTLAVSALALLQWAAFLARDALLTKRALVRVTLSGVDAVDWRGRLRCLEWSGIRQVTIRHLSEWSHVQLVPGEGRPVCLGWHLERLSDLVVAVTDRAGLTDRQDKWWGTLYTRPVE